MTTLKECIYFVSNHLLSNPHRHNTSLLTHITIIVYSYLFIVIKLVTLLFMRPNDIENISKISKYT